MNEKNVMYLKDNLKYMGFGETLNDSLEAAVKEAKPDFQLTLNQKMNEGDLSATLHFRQSPSSGMYFFNSYEARLSRENGYQQSQQFYLNNGRGVTLKEAYNLLAGRSVLKELTSIEGVNYHAWLKIDFNQRKSENQHQVRQFHAEKYGFDLLAELSKLNLSPLTQEKEQQLLQSLQKGNRQAASFIKDQKEELLFIEANPQFKTINISNGRGQYLSRSEKEHYTYQETSVVANEVPPSSADNTDPEEKQALAIPRGVEVPKEHVESGDKKNIDPFSETNESRTKAIKDLLPAGKRKNKKSLKIN